MLTGVRLDEKSSAACAITSWRDRIHLAWTGTDTKLNLISSPDGRSFATPHQIPFRALTYDTSGSSDSSSGLVVTAPALAGLPDRLYLAWTGTKAAVTLLVVDSAAPTVLEHRSYVSPAVSVSGRGAPVLAWAGKDRRVNLLNLSENRADAPLRLPEARSWVAPALCRHRDTLVLAWTGTDRRVNLLTLHEHGPGTHLRLEEARTVCAPAICSHRDTVYLAWTGNDRRVNLLTVTENHVSAPARLDEARSLVAPAICSHRDDLYLAWTGTDAHLNVARPST